MTVSFAPYISQREISVQEVYGDFLSTPNIPNASSIPKGYKAVAFRPPKKGERFLCVGCDIQVADFQYSESAPRIIVEVDLSEIEKAYGINATVESLWAHYCDTPSDYGKPTFDFVPEKTGIGYITPIDVAGGVSRWAPHGYFWNQGPKCVWAYKLTDVEKVYGLGATIRDLWKQYCLNPECYGEPRFGLLPIGNSHRVGVVWMGLNPYFTGPYEYCIDVPRIHAFYLNPWQKLYGESITDAEALEKLLRDRKELQANQELEPELRRPLVSEVFVSPLTILTVEDLGITGPRAIVRKKVRRYLKLPLEGVYEVLVNHGGDSLNRRIYKRQIDGTQIVYDDAQIVKE